MEMIKVIVEAKGVPVTLHLDKKYYGYLIKDGSNEIPTVTIDQLFAGAYEEQLDKNLACVQPIKKGVIAR